MKDQATTHIRHFGDRPERPLKESLKRGWFGRCPDCGRGSIFHKYLSVKDSCDSCGLNFSGHQADDAPPYFTIVIVGHIVVPLMISIDLAMNLSLTGILTLGISTTIVAAMLLLPRIKGALIGLQWAKYMHGFDNQAEPEAPHLT
ncbi:MAG: DUF983 domain-containing protein [Alphaproteobacteria bacterium]